MKALPQFNSLGSDPEFLFVTRKEFRPTVIQANSVITGNKVAALKSFVGTDNHAATAELRPGPAHNVGRHLYDIAYGLSETDKWLATSKKFKALGVHMSAQPFLGDEPLGGHIHTSFFLDEPETKRIMELNRVCRRGVITALDPNLPTPTLTPANIAFCQKYIESHFEKKLFRVEDYIELMDYLIWPFECAVQPWWDRLRRNTRYGGLDGMGEKVRQNISHPSNVGKASKFAYLHYEYRVPSTWLCHPWLAYAYLGLAKLVMLNTGLIMEQITTTQSKLRYENIDGQPRNDEAKNVFENRFKLLVNKGKWTTDIRGLTRILPLCFENRAAWFEIPGQPIDLEAWRGLL